MNTHPAEIPHPALVLHDFRDWTEASHWTQSSLALVARKLRAETGFPSLRTFCFLWEFDHPERWRFIHKGSLMTPGRLPGRGRMRRLTPKDWLPDARWAPIHAWEPWLGRPNPLEPLASQPGPSLAAGDPTQFGAGSRFAALPLQDQLALAYWIRAGRPDPNLWLKLLPPVIPESAFFQVFNWKRMALQLSLVA